MFVPRSGASPLPLRVKASRQRIFIRASRASAIARARYREGVADFLALLDAERTQLQAEDAVAQAEAQVFTSVVGVYKALGGIGVVTQPITRPSASLSPLRGARDLDGRTQ